MLPMASRPGVQRLCVLLRLAVLLHRARHDIELRGLRLLADKRALSVRFARGWLRQHPLTQADLEQEAMWLKAAGFRLDID